MSKNKTDIKRVCVFVSKLASFIGCHKYQPQENTFDELLDKISGKDKINYSDNRISLISLPILSECVSVNESGYKVIDNVKATKEIEKLLKSKCDDKQLLEINKLINVEPPEIKEIKNGDMQTNIIKSESKSEPDKSAISEPITKDKIHEKLNKLKESIKLDLDAPEETQWICQGIEKEGGRLDKLEKELKGKIVNRNTKGGYYEMSNNSYIYGKCDGILDDIIIETKERKNRLFGKVQDYEKIQIYAYMKIFKLKKAKLVENFENETKTYDIKYEQKYWDMIKTKYDDAINKFRETRLTKIEIIIEKPLTTNNLITNKVINTEKDEISTNSINSNFDKNTKRECIKCKESKILINDFGKIGKGYRKICKDCYKKK